MATAIKRRDFVIGLSLAPLAALAATHSSPPPRAPYVDVGDAPDSLTWHLWDRPLLPAARFIVTQLSPWDGTGYPIILASLGWRGLGEPGRVLWDGGYDHDWSVLRRDVPDDFWRLASASQYPNVHAFVREQRFGEPPSLMREIMERNRIIGPPLGRPYAVPLRDEVA